RRPTGPQRTRHRNHRGRDPFGAARNPAGRGEPRIEPRSDPSRARAPVEGRSSDPSGVAGRPHKFLALKLRAPCARSYACRALIRTLLRARAAALAKPVSLNYLEGKPRLDRAFARTHDRP